MRSFLFVLHAWESRTDHNTTPRTEWFDSNYHYIVPELSPETEFSLGKTGPIKAVEHYKEAKEAGYETRPVILGPITYLLIGKPATDLPVDTSFKPISLLDKMLPVYKELLQKLKAAGAASVQIDEPALVMDSTNDLGAEYEKVYSALAGEGVDITLATCASFCLFSELLL